MNHDSAMPGLRFAARKVGILMMVKGVVLGLMRLNFLSLMRPRERLGNLREVNLFGCGWSGLGLVRMGNHLAVDILG